MVGSLVYSRITADLRISFEVYGFAEVVVHRMCCQVEYVQFNIGLYSSYYSDYKVKKEHCWVEDVRYQYVMSPQFKLTKKKNRKS